jgi:hypothetical protein
MLSPTVRREHCRVSQALAPGHGVMASDDRQLAREPPVPSGGISGGGRTCRERGHATASLTFPVAGFLCDTSEWRNQHKGSEAGRPRDRGLCRPFVSPPGSPRPSISGRPGPARHLAPKRFGAWSNKDSPDRSQRTSASSRRRKRARWQVRSSTDSATARSRARSKKGASVASRRAHQSSVRCAATFRSRNGRVRQNAPPEPINRSAGSTLELCFHSRVVLIETERSSLQAAFDFACGN